MHEYKTVPAFVKSIDEDEGIVTHLISVYGIIDGGDDIAHKGMFTKTLQERGDRVRVVDNHRNSSVLDVVGKNLAFYEVSKGDLPAEVLVRYPEATGGMMVKTQFLIATPEGEGAFIRIKEKAISEFSYGYNTMDSDKGVVGDRKVRNLRAIRLWEYGPVIFGMNDAAIAVSAKGVDVAELHVVECGPLERFVEDSLKEIVVVVGTVDGKTMLQTFNFDKEVWTEEEVKELGLFRQLNALTRAFNKKFEWEFYVHDVYEDFVIASSYENPYFYKVGFTESEGSYTFIEREEWETGTLEFVPTKTEPDAAAKIRLIDIELEQCMVFSGIEAGPA